MTTLDNQQVARIRDRVDNAANRLARRLGGPLLVMYYPDESSIDTDDVAVLYRHLRLHGLSPDEPLPTLDVALHTLGGDANASY